MLKFQKLSADCFIIAIKYFLIININMNITLILFNIKMIIFE